MVDPLADLAVVIVTYHSSEHIGGALRSLPTARLATTVVVDNASTDDTVVVAEAVGDPAVTVVRNEHNVGFGAGNNVGLRAAPPTRWIAFVNPDAVVTAETLAALVTYLDAHPSAALVAPRLTKSGAPISSAGRLPTVAGLLRSQLPNPVRLLFPERRHPPTYDRSGPVGQVEGACMVADRAALEAIGGFDERYFLFFEESDLAKRLAAAGRTVDLVATVFAEHAVGASRRRESLGSLPHYVTSAVRYLDRWHGRRSVVVFRAGARLAWRLRRIGDLSADDRRRLVDALAG